MADSDLLLAGTVIQRVDLGDEVVVLRTRSPGRTTSVIVAAMSRARGVGIVAGKKLRPAASAGASAAQQQARRRLEGARVEWLDSHRVVLARGGERVVVAAGARIEIRAAGAGEESAAPAAARADDEAAWNERGEALAEAAAVSSIEARRAAVTAAIRRAIVRIERRAEAVRGDLARIDVAAAAAARASIFVAEAARAPRGARRLTVTDWSSGEPCEASIDLDPARPAREQLDALFKRARRLKQGGAIGARRLAEAAAALEALRALAPRVAEAAVMDALDPLAAEARRAAPRDFRLGSGEAAAPAERAARGPGGSLPYRTFLGASGARILVGKGAAHNDTLTFRVARPHDLWLHAKGWKGAHVIVPLEKGADCPADLLVEAAHLAAHFSDARGEGVVEIEHTPRRYLRKPRGSPPGLVVVEREKVTALRTEPATLARLLANEEQRGRAE